MKRLMTAIIPLFAVLCVIASVLPSSAAAANYLAGNVTYSGGGGVGSGKPVYIYDTPTHYIGSVNTNGSSQYNWRFYPPFYVYKVRCTFVIGSTVYAGETIIDDTLTADKWAHIVVTIIQEK